MRLPRRAALAVPATLLAIAAAGSAGSAGCGRDRGPAATPGDPPVVMGPAARAEDPGQLPPPGTAPPAVEAGARLAAMWDAPIHSLRGQATSLAAFRGKAILVVNVASQCGLTPQYSALEALQEKYGQRGFTVVGFPCNQFGGQEPGTAEEIETFCSTKYGVTFPMMEKIEVNGPGRHPIYQRLTEIADAAGHDGDIRWNFEKFLISADGAQVTRFSPEITPDDPSVIAAIEAALPR